MQRFELDTQAGQLTMELARRGVAATTRVHVLVEVDDLPVAAMAQTGGAFAWLAEEPDLYTPADVLPRP